MEDWNMIGKISIHWTVDFLWLLDVNTFKTVFYVIMLLFFQSKKISNNQELIQSDPISCPQNQKGNN